MDPEHEADEVVDRKTVTGGGLLPARVVTTSGS
jgi:hypothetical protein